MSARLALTVALVAGACAPTSHVGRRPPTTTTTTTPAPTAPTTEASPPTSPPGHPAAPAAAAPPPSPPPHSPPAAGVGGAGEGMPGQDVTLAAIARCEGYPDHVYSDHPGPSSASGKYGVLDSTWDGFGGYESAADAPEAVQDQWAAEAYARAGTRPWRASRSCWAGAAA